MKKTLKTFQDQEQKIKDMLSKNRDSMNFKDDFYNFKIKTNEGMNEIFEKSNEMLKIFT